MNGQKTIGKRQDRLLAFFDAVMAIAMTVLALEITVPQLSTVSHAQRYAFFVSLTCYLISFVAMSTLWYIHNNFFSSHDLTGNNGEIVLHLVLLFVITLFQPLTRAIGEHPDDWGVRAFYLLDFFAMYGLTALIMVWIRRREEQINQRRDARKSFVKEKSKELTKDTTEAPLSDEAKELGRVMRLIYALQNPEAMQEKMAEYMPDEYQQELTDLKKKRETSYRMSIYTVITMAIAVLVAVVLLIFSVWWSYIALAAGLIAIFLIRHHGQAKIEKI